MTKRLVDIDDAVLERAREVLGTVTLKDTVNTALAESVQARDRSVGFDLEAFAEVTQDLSNPEIMAGAWD